LELIKFRTSIAIAVASYLFNIAFQQASFGVLSQAWNMGFGTFNAGVAIVVSNNVNLGLVPAAFLANLP
jgi:hypothetical protein